MRAWFEGAQGDVDTLLEWCQHGPPGAVVEREPGGLRRFVVFTVEKGRVRVVDQFIGDLTAVTARGA